MVCAGLQRATFQALRCYYAARSYLVAGKPLEAQGLFQRTAQRVQQAEAAWDDLERPSTEDLAELEALKAQTQVCAPSLALLQDPECSARMCNKCDPSVGIALGKLGKILWAPPYSVAFACPFSYGRGALLARWNIWLGLDAFCMCSGMCACVTVFSGRLMDGSCCMRGVSHGWGCVQAWRCAAHAECVAQQMLTQQEAQEGIDQLGLDAKPAGATPGFHPSSLPSKPSASRKQPSADQETQQHCCKNSKYLCLLQSLALSSLFMSAECTQSW